MRKVLKVATMIAIAIVMQVGANKLAYANRGHQALGGEKLVFPAVLVLEYKAFCTPDEEIEFGEEDEY